MKKTSYKYQIEQALNTHHWQIEYIDFINEWWNDDYWKVTFTFNPQIFFYLFFIFDPMAENRIYNIVASTEILTAWNDDDNEIASICMSKRHFDKKLAEFINKIEVFKLKLTN